MSFYLPIYIYTHTYIQNTHTLIFLSALSLLPPPPPLPPHHHHHHHRKTQPATIHLRLTPLQPHLSHHHTSATDHTTSVPRR
ncbi:hypothetical protein HanIR_Chr07g0323031 [Helianthus annuus]|nr:hypothetical protein HanIR_Chr07g0323031 [Helianthus annuus]